MQVTDSTLTLRPMRKAASFVSASVAWCLAAILLLIGMAVPAHAQYSASLQGNVADTQGALIPGAKLTLTDKETNRVLTATSNDAGNFVFNTLPPSTYKLTVSRDGFKTKVLDNVKILSEQANALNVSLEVGGQSETVTVNAADHALIDTETGSISGTIDQNDLAKMPDFGRDPLQLVALAPGIFGDSSQQAGGGTYSLPGNQGDGSAGSSSGPYMTENKPQVFGNGGRNDTNGISIDGVQVTSVTWGSAAVVTPNPDTIKEIKVVTNPYDASLGRFSGAQIQIISQNGTNQFHGTALSSWTVRASTPISAGIPTTTRSATTPSTTSLAAQSADRFCATNSSSSSAMTRIRNTGTATGGGWYDTRTFDELALRQARLPASSWASRAQALSTRAFSRDRATTTSAPTSDLCRA